MELTPILKRPPLYPMFIGGVIWLVGEELRGLMLVQHLLGLVNALGAFGLGLLIFARPAWSPAC